MKIAQSSSKAVLQVQLQSLSIHGTFISKKYCSHFCVFIGYFVLLKQRNNLLRNQFLSPQVQDQSAILAQLVIFESPDETFSSLLLLHPTWIMDYWYEHLQSS